MPQPICVCPLAGYIHILLPGSNLATLPLIYICTHMYVGTLNHLDAIADVDEAEKKTREKIAGKNAVRKKMITDKMEKKGSKGTGKSDQCWEEIS